MSLLTLGLNHKTAPVSIREQAVFAPDALNHPLAALTDISGVKEAAIVSTCNRTEIYCGLERPVVGDIVHWFHEFHRAEHPEQFTPYLFEHHDRAAVQHLLRVCSGLDSLILGEPQILGQIKQAYQAADTHGCVGSELGRLFQHAFSVAKRVRTDTAIGSSPVSVAFAAVQLARQIFEKLSDKTALLLGAGETIELAARHLKSHNIGNIIIANRTRQRAERLAEEFEGEAIALNELGDYLHRGDIIVASTAAPLPILGKGAVEQALKKRRRRPIFMVDIAVPRDIEPQVGELDDVFLYTVDDLNDIIEEGHRSRAEAATQAERIVDYQTDEFMRWLQSLDAQASIREYRTQVQALQKQLLAKAHKQLQSGKPAEEVLNHLAHALTNRLLHAPSSFMRQAGESGNVEHIEMAQAMLGLKKGHHDAIHSGKTRRD